MTLNLEQAKAAVTEGEGEDRIRRFIDRAIDAHVTLLANGEASTEADDDAIVAALALLRLLDTADARKLLKMRRRPRGKDFDGKDYVNHAPAMDVAIRYHTGKLERKAAIEALAAVVSTRTVHPDHKTVERLLLDLEVRHVENLDLVRHLAESQGKPALTKAELHAALDRLYGK